MKTNELSSKKEWDFSRFVRISCKVIMLYIIITTAFILIFGNKSEIVWKIILTSKMPKEIVLQINSVPKMVFNSILILLDGLALFILFKSIKDALIEERKKNVGDFDAVAFFMLFFSVLFYAFYNLWGLSFLLSVGTLFGLVGLVYFNLKMGLYFSFLILLLSGMIIGFPLGLGGALLFTLCLWGICGFHLLILAGILLLIKTIFSKKFWMFIGKQIVVDWKWFIS